MDEQEKNQILKPRSAAACIREGFKLIANHPVTLLTATWPCILLTAVATLLYFNSTTSLMRNIVSEDLTGSWSLISVGLSVLLLIVTSYFLIARVILVLKYLRDNGTLARIKAFKQWRPTIGIAFNMLPFVLIEILVSALFTGAGALAVRWAMAQQNITLRLTVFALLLFVGLLMLIALLPLMQTFYSYTMDGGHFLQTLRTTYRKGLRHIGKLFATNVLAIVLISVLISLVILPLEVLTMANTQSFMGVVVLGDESGMPGYMGWLLGITIVVCTSLAIYCYLAFFTSNLYVYGSIESIEAGRNKYTIQ